MRMMRPRLKEYAYHRSAGQSLNFLLFSRLSEWAALLGPFLQIEEKSISKIELTLSLDDTMSRARNDQECKTLIISIFISTTKYFFSKYFNTSFKHIDLCCQVLHFRWLVIHWIYNCETERNNQE